MKYKKEIEEFKKKKGIDLMEIQSEILKQIKL